MTRDERKELERLFRGKTWAARDLASVVRDIQDQWPEERDRRLLHQFHDIVQTFNNILLHQSGLSLDVAGVVRPGESVSFAIGPSRTHVHGALSGAFWCYANLVSLVLEDERHAELAALYSDHIAAFVEARFVEDKG